MEIHIHAMCCVPSLIEIQKSVFSASSKPHAKYPPFCKSIRAFCCLWTHRCRASTVSNCFGTLDLEFGRQSSWSPQTRVGSWTPSSYTYSATCSDLFPRVWCAPTCSQLKDTSSIFRLGTRLLPSARLECGPPQNDS